MRCRSAVDVFAAQSVETKVSEYGTAFSYVCDVSVRLLKCCAEREREICFVSRRLTTGAVVVAAVHGEPDENESVVLSAIAQGRAAR